MREGRAPAGGQVPPLRRAAGWGRHDGIRALQALEAIAELGRVAAGSGDARAIYDRIAASVLSLTEAAHCAVWVWRDARWEPEAARGGDAQAGPPPAVGPDTGRGARMLVEDGGRRVILPMGSASADRAVLSVVGVSGALSAFDLALCRAMAAQGAAAMAMAAQVRRVQEAEDAAVAALAARAADDDGSPRPWREAGARAEAVAASRHWPPHVQVQARRWAQVYWPSPGTGQPPLEHAAAWLRTQEGLGPWLALDRAALRAAAVAQARVLAERRVSGGRDAPATGGERLGADRRAAARTLRGRALGGGACAGLTAREGDVLGCLAAGQPNGEIARDLMISPKTVKVHVHRLLRKLGVADRTQAALWAVRHGVPPRGGPVDHDKRRSTGHL